MIHRFLLILAVATATVTASAQLPDVQPGDIIFQTNAEGQGLAIMRATRSEYSHVGIVGLRDGKPYVLEAGSTVKFTPLADFIARGDRQHFVVKRLKNASIVMTPKALEALERAGKPFVGLPYDNKFRWSDDQIYCSELVWKIYEQGLGIQLSLPQKVGEFNLSDPVVQEDIKVRYGGEVPLDEIAVSPQALLESSLLITVAGN